MTNIKIVNSVKLVRKHFVNSNYTFLSHPLHILIPSSIMFESIPAYFILFLICSVTHSSVQYLPQSPSILVGSGVFLGFDLLNCLLASNTSSLYLSYKSIHLFINSRWYIMNLLSITLLSTPITCQHVYFKLQISCC